jgi:hypothetical protein
LQSIVGGLEPPILQGALKSGGVPPQQVERLDALDGQTGRYVAVAIDIQPNLYTPELGRIEANFEPVLAGEALPAISIASPATGMAAACGSGCETRGPGCVGCRMRLCRSHERRRGVGGSSLRNEFVGRRCRHVAMRAIADGLFTASLSDVLQVAVLCRVLLFS